MITEEQRKENAKSTIAYLSTVAGIVGSYVGAQAGGIMLEQGVDFLDTFGIMANSFANMEFIPPLNVMSLLGGIVGFGTVAAWQCQDPDSRISLSMDQFRDLKGEALYWYDISKIFYEDDIWNY